MQNAVVKLFPKQIVKYQFINRGKHHFPEGFAEELRASVNAMAELKLTKDEKKIHGKNLSVYRFAVFRFFRRLSLRSFRSLFLKTEMR
jgi:hypothetical protein